MIYLITAREFGRVKIGFTANDPNLRRNKIKADCPTPVALEAVLPGGRKEERELHRRFSEHRICGEWFAITAEIEHVIAENRVAAPEPPPTLHSVDVHPSSAEIVGEVMRFCMSRQLTPTEFGLMAMNDKSFVSGILTKRRRIWPETEAKVRRFMATYKPDNPQDAAA